MRSRPAAAIATAALTLLAYAVFAGVSAPSSRAQSVCIPGPCPTTPTDPPTWTGSRWTAPTTDNQIVTDGVFEGTFKFGAPVGIDKVDLAIDYTPGHQNPAACGDGKHRLTQEADDGGTTPTTSSSQANESEMDFLFEVGFVCNGFYTAEATGHTTGDDHSLDKLDGLHISVPPSPPLSLVATDNGNQTVAITWEPPNAPPPDVIGYRISKRAASAGAFSAVVDAGPAATTFTDTAFPSEGGSFVFRIETLRSSPDGALTSLPVDTDGALTVNGVSSGGTSGGSVVGTRPTEPPPTVTSGAGATANPPAATGGDGTLYFDDTTLAGDDLKPGDAEAAAPGGATIRRASGEDGAGLIKPFGAALNLGVWAGLMLFLTRRAASAERAELRSLQLEHSP